jgi:hypothetical protein
MVQTYVTPTKVQFTPNDFFIIRQSIQELTKHRGMFDIRFRNNRDFLIREYHDVIVDSCMLFPEQLPMYCEVELHSFMSVFRRLKMLNNFCVAENDQTCLKLSSVLSDAILSFNTVLKRAYDE